MCLLVILVILILIAAAVTFVIIGRRGLGKCIYPIVDSVEMGCICATHSTNKYCDDKNGTWTKNSTDCSNELEVCKNKFLGVCVVKKSSGGGSSCACNYPSTKDLCSKQDGTFYPGETDSGTECHDKYCK